MKKIKWPWVSIAQLEAEEHRYDMLKESINQAWSEDSEVNPVRVYIVSLLYHNKVRENIAVTGMYFVKGDGVDTHQDIVEIGTNASELHPTRGVPDSYENSLRITNYLYQKYEAGMPQLIDYDALASVRIIGLYDDYLGERITQEDTNGSE